MIFKGFSLGLSEWLLSGGGLEGLEWSHLCFCGPLQVVSPADSHTLLSYSGEKGSQGLFQTMLAHVPLAKSKSYSQTQILGVEEETLLLDGEELLVPLMDHFNSQSPMS